MIKDFNNLTSSGISYGGHSGSKKGVIIDNERWFLKYPKTTKSMEVQNLSYTTSPLSEYIGSQIYESLNIDTHKTLLGIANNKVVVACKDFLKSNEVILDYNSIKNDYDEETEEKLESLSSHSSLTYNDLDELLVVMDNNQYFKKLPELKTRFWEMFIIDALIGNNDRNENNWGVILNKDSGNLKVSPVYDNGASFYSKSDDEKLENNYNDEFKFKQSVYDSSTCSFSKNGHKINPLKYIESMENEDCNKALINVISKIDFTKIENIINSIPTTYDGLNVCSDIQKKYYIKAMKYRYDNVLIPTYKELTK